MEDLRSRMAPYVERAGRAVENALRDVEPAELREAALHYPSAGGKRLRPVVAELAAECAGGSLEAGIPVAVAIELIHNFSLVHDDLMDEDDLRRGRPTVHKKWGTATAILAGDVQFARAFEVLASQAGDGGLARDATREISEAVRVLCEGQALDMAFETREAVTEAEYLRMIHGKTARLFEAAAKGGAILAGASPDLRERLATYGRNLGMAFQVHDDLLDLTAPTTVLGKPALSDLKRGKRTLVLILAETQGTEADRAAMKRVVGNPEAPDAEARALVERFEAMGVLAEAGSRVQAYTEEAVTSLDALPDSPARALLTDLARWAATRTG